MVERKITLFCSSLLGLLFLFMFAVGRQWHTWQRVTLYVIVSIVAQQAISQIFMRHVPVKKDVKHD
jgi:hypothetical protein